MVPLEAEILTAGLALRRAGKDRFHGFELAKLLAERGSRTLTAHGTLYKALSRLESFGLLHSSWEDPDIAAAARRPRRRLYEVTGAAEAALAAWRAEQPSPPRARRAAWGET